jgi:hypothetical protein
MWTVVKWKFDDAVFKRWCSDVMMCCQPMQNYPATYRDMEFEAKGGYWWFNGKPYALLEDLYKALTTYDEEINRLVATVADS